MNQDLGVRKFVSFQFYRRLVKYSIACLVEMRGTLRTYYISFDFTFKKLNK